MRYAGPVSSASMWQSNAFQRRTAQGDDFVFVKLGLYRLL